MNYRSSIFLIYEALGLFQTESTNIYFYYAIQQVVFYNNLNQNFAEVSLWYIKLEKITTFLSP